MSTNPKIRRRFNNTANALRVRVNSLAARYMAEAGHVVATCKTPEMALNQLEVFPFVPTTMSLPDILIQFATDPREKVALVGLVVFLFLAAVFVVAFVEHD